MACPPLGVSMCAAQACVLPYPKVISFTPKGTAFTSKGGNPQKQLCLYLTAHSPCQLAQTLQVITIGAPVAVALVAGMCCVGALQARVKERGWPSSGTLAARASCD